MSASTSSRKQESLTSQNDPLVYTIKNRFDRLSYADDQRAAPACIYRIPKKLRAMNEEYYTPKVVSLGPYTHGTTGLEFMENVKLRYLNSFLKWSTMRIEDVVRFVREREARARACYASEIFRSDEFLEILLVDVAFVLMYLLNWLFDIKVLDLEHGAVSEEDILYDFFLLENQLPLFLLQELFQVASSSSKFEHPFTLLLERFNSRIQQATGEKISLEDASRFRHLVDLFRECYKPSKPRSASSYILQKSHSLAELHEAGVKLKLSSSSTSNPKLLDIEFKDGVLQIPDMHIEDSTETILRNILAFEQCHANQPELKARYVTDYIVAMSKLIKTPRDAELLGQAGILRNHIGDHSQVSNLFFNLDKNIYYDKETFYYARLFEDLDKHCEVIWHKWCALLKHEYLENPWKNISLVAAAILLCLTLVQTIFTIKPLMNKN